MDRRLRWIPSMLLLVVGCAGEPSWSGTVVDSAGVALVHNGETGLWSPGDAWTVREALRIGTAEGDADYQFGTIAGITEGRDGSIYVLDQQGQHVKVFGPDGGYRFRFGGAGGGPGELGPGAGPILHGAGDTLFIPDIGQRRVNRYLEDGSDAGSFALGIESGIPIRWEEVASGELVGQFRPLALPDQPSTDSMDAILVRQADGSVADTIFRFPSGQTFRFTRSGPDITIFSTEPWWTMRDSRRFAFGRNDEYRIELRDSSGALERVITRPFERMPVTDTDRTAVRTAIEMAWRDAGMPPPAMAQLSERLKFGEYFPVYQQFQAGPEETLWVRRILRPSDLPADELDGADFQRLSGSPEWEIFDRDGRYLGVVTLPRRFNPLRVRGRAMLGVWSDELDVQYVVKLEILTVTE